MIGVFPNSTMSFNPLALGSNSAWNPTTQDRLLSPDTMQHIKVAHKNFKFQQNCRTKVNCNTGVFNYYIEHNVHVYFNNT